MVRTNGFVILASFFLMALAIAQWQFLGSVFDHYFSLLTIGLVASGLALGIGVSGVLSAWIREKDIFQSASVFFSLSALSIIVGILLNYLIPLGSIVIFLIVLTGAWLPYFCAGIAFMFIMKRKESIILHLAWVTGSVAALLAAGIFFNITQSPLVLALVTAAGLAITSFIFASRPLFPLIVFVATVFSGVTIYLSGFSPTLSPNWSDSGIKMAKPLYANLTPPRFSVPPVTDWSATGRTDMLTYAGKNNVRWIITNATDPVPIVQATASGYSTRWWKARFPLTVVPLLLGKPQRYLSLGAVPGSELMIARHFGANSTGLAYNSSPMLARSEGLSEPGYIIIPSIRNYLQQNNNYYDQIFIPLTQLTRGASTYSNLEDSYLYTKEAFQLYWERLAPGGLMVVTAIDPRLFIKTIYTAWEGIGGIVRARTWGMRLKSGTPSLTPYRFSFMIMKGVPPVSFSDSIKEVSSDMPIKLLFGPGIKSQRPFELLYQTDPFENGRKVLTGFLSRRTQAWIDLEPATDGRPFLFQLRQKLDLQQKWVLGVGVAGLIYCFIFAISALRRPDSKLHKRHLPVPLYLSYFGIHSIVITLLTTTMIWQCLLVFGLSATSTIIVLTACFLGIAGGIIFADRIFREKSARVRNVVLPLGTIILMALSFFAVSEGGVSWGNWSSYWYGVMVAIASFCMSFMIVLSYQNGLLQLDEQLPALRPWTWSISGFSALTGVVLVVLFAKLWAWQGIWFIAAAGCLLILCANFWLWRGTEN